MRRHPIYALLLLACVGSIAASGSFSGRVHQSGTPHPRVILYVVDGLNAAALKTLTDAADAGVATGFSRLIAEGAHTWNARSSPDSTRTKPGHTSMFHGRFPTENPGGDRLNCLSGHYWDTFNNNDGNPAGGVSDLSGNASCPRELASIFSMARAQGLSTRFLFSKQPCNGIPPTVASRGCHFVMESCPTQTIGDADCRFDRYEVRDLDMTDLMASITGDAAYDLTVIHDYEPDLVGHTSGPGSAYDDALRNVSARIATVLANAPADTAVIITSDHGAFGGNATLGTTGRGIDSPSDGNPLQHNHSLTLANYEIPLFVWGWPDQFPAGSDVYTSPLLGLTDPGDAYVNQNGAAHPFFLPHVATLICERVVAADWLASTTAAVCPDFLPLDSSGAGDPSPTATLSVSPTSCTAPCDLTQLRVSRGNHDTDALWSAGFACDCTTPPCALDDVTYGTANESNYDAVDACDTPLAAPGVYDVRGWERVEHVEVWSDPTTVTVSAASNAPPTANAGGPYSRVGAGSEPISGSCPDDGLPNPPGTVTSTWTLTAGTGVGEPCESATFDSASSLSTTLDNIANVTGTCTVQLECDDSDLQDTDTEDVTVTQFVAGGEEQRCQDLGANCVCANSLDSSTLLQHGSISTSFQPQDGSAKHCGQDLAATGYPVTLNNESASMVAITEAPAAATVSFVLRRTGPSETGTAQIHGNIPQSTTKRLCIRQYYHYSNDYTALPADCQGNKNAEFNWGAGPSGGTKLQWANKNENSFWDWAILGMEHGGPLPTCRADDLTPWSGCNLKVFVNPSACFDEWCIMESCVSSDDASGVLNGTNIELEGYIRETSQTSAATVVYDNVAKDDNAGPVPMDAGDARGTTMDAPWLVNMWREGEGDPNCVGYREHSLVIQCEWDTNAGQWCGPAFEMEGCANGEPGGCPLP